MSTKKIYSTYLLMPALILYMLLFVVPCVTAFGYSLTNWNSVSESIRFIGLDNFKEILNPANDYLSSISHTMVFAVFSTLFKAVIGLALAMLLNQKLRTQELLRGVYFMPYAISPLIIGIIFTSVLNPETGVLNSFFHTIGLDFMAQSWLVDPKFALGSVIAVEVWREIGLNMVIYIAGMQMIDKSYYEAASIDGAGNLAKFIKITIPFLASATTINLVLNTIHGLRVFDIVFSLTGGGPGNTTEVLNTAVLRAYSMGTYGLSTALGVIVFIITSVIALSALKILMPKEE